MLEFIVFFINNLIAFVLIYLCRLLREILLLFQDYRDQEPRHENIEKSNGVGAEHSYFKMTKLKKLLQRCPLFLCTKIQYIPKRSWLWTMWQLTRNGDSCDGQWDHQHKYIINNFFFILLLYSYFKILFF